MIEWLEIIFSCDDYAELLGDLYQPTVSVILVIAFTLSFGSLCSAVTCIIRGLFRSSGG